MAGFRDHIIHTVGSAAGLVPHQLLRFLTGQKLLSPFYHAISDDYLPHIENLYRVKGIAAFEKDLDFLLKHYEPLDYLAFKKRKSGSDHEKPGFLLSFDDGLSSFYHHIAPILLKKGVPAVCFLNSNFIDNKDLFYRYKASLLIETIKNKPKLITKISEQFGSTAEILSVRYLDQHKLDKAAKKIGLDFRQFLIESKPYLTQDQITSLISQGFHFGGHSVDHPHYQDLSLSDQIAQTTDSISEIKKRFELDYNLFSFPFTDYQVSPTFFKTIKNLDNDILSFGCAGLKKESVKNHFQRIPLEMRKLSAAQIINAEMMYYLLKMPLGKNKIDRS